jgi:hypothetical protein
MNLELDRYLYQLAPWDFTVTVGHFTYPTRPLLVGDLLLVERMERSENVSMTQLHDLVASLFVGEQKPDVKAWTIDALREVILGAVRHWTEASKKKPEAAGGAKSP